MKNTELVAKIETEKRADSKKHALEDQKVIKFMIVQIKDKRYAFYADQIKEIVMDASLYFVPFVPHYIRGFINRHGEPYTVFDLHALFEQELLDSKTFLISNVEHDQIAFLVSSVIEILKVPENEVHIITSADDHDSFFVGAVSSKGMEIFILNIPTILERLDHDLELS